MNQRTQNIKLIKELRHNIIITAKNPEAWSYIHNHMLMIDMLDHMRLISNDPIICGRGSYQPHIMIILFNDTRLYDLKNAMRLTGLPPEDTWITVFNKSNSLEANVLFHSIKTELDILEPTNTVIYMPEHIDMSNQIEDLIREYKNVHNLSKMEQRLLIDTLLTY